MGTKTLGRKCTKCKKHKMGIFLIIGVKKSPDFIRFVVSKDRRKKEGGIHIYCCHILVIREGCIIEIQGNWAKKTKNLNGTQVDFRERKAL
jgi:hypothetical protein